MSEPLTATSLWTSAKGQKTTGKEGWDKPNQVLGWTGEGEKWEKNWTGIVEADFFSFFPPAVKALTNNLSCLLMVLQLAGRRAICLLIQLACLFIRGGWEGAVTGQTVPVSDRLLSGWEDDLEHEHPASTAPDGALITALSQAFWGKKGKNKIKKSNPRCIPVNGQSRLTIKVSQLWCHQFHALKVLVMSDILPWTECFI